jgi:predicted O-linked N-acetylglucosamine transferase (SPINDLY family)
LAYQGTTGLTTMDYRLTDPHLDPPGMFDRYYSEASWRLPDSFWCYDPLTIEPSVNALPALKTGYVTFGCLNNFCKVTDDVLRLWALICFTGSETFPDRKFATGWSSFNGQGWLSELQVLLAAPMTSGG